MTRLPIRKGTPCTCLIMGGLIALRSLTLTLLSSPASLAQPQEATLTQPAFEAASIKLSPPDAAGETIRLLPNGVTARNVSLRALVLAAYHIEGFQFEGGPRWFSDEHYDVTAKSQAKASYDDDRLMLRSLLADRFKLRLHTEEREVAMFALTLAKGG